LLVGTRRLLSPFMTLLSLLVLAGLPRLRPLLRELAQAIQLGGHPHAPVLITGRSQRACTLDDLSSLLSALGIHRRLCQLFLDLVEALRASLRLRKRRRACDHHHAAAGKQGPA
jgi:hypothetical protein